MPADKPIVITITVLPFAKGKRRLIVSGAPQGEMPVVHTGEFSQIHQLVNAAWAELIKRKPQVPKLPKEKAGAARTSPVVPAEQVAPADSEGDAPEGDAPQGDAQERDQLVASDEPAAPPAPLLSSIDNGEADAGSDAGSGAEEDTNTND